MWQQGDQQLADSSTRFVRTVVELFNREPFSALQFVHPAVELELPLDVWPGVSGRRFHGYQGVVDAIAPIFAAFDELSAEAVDVVDVGPNAFVARIRHRGRGGGSGALCTSDLFHAAHLRDGRVVRWEIFVDEALALAAAQVAVRSNGRAAEPCEVQP